jgi:hypothetical protein
MTIPTSTDSHQQAGPRATIELQPGAPFDSFRGLLPTAQYAVYVLLDANGDALYVGQSAHPRTRLRDHWRLKEWFPEVAGIELHLVADELAARTLEKLLTSELDPACSEITWADDVRLTRLAGGAA